MNPILRVRAAVTGVLLLALAGCAGPTVGAQGPTCSAPLPAEPGAATMAAGPVAITDAQLKGRVMAQAWTRDRHPASPAGTMEVWARFFNCGDVPLQVEARTHFLDVSQAPTEPVTAWTRVFLPARAYGV